MQRAEQLSIQGDVNICSNNLNLTTTFCFKKKKRDKFMLLRCSHLQRRSTKHKTCGPMSPVFDLRYPIVTPSDVETNETNPNHVLMMTGNWPYWTKLNKGGKKQHLWGGELRKTAGRSFNPAPPAPFHRVAPREGMGGGLGEGLNFN